MNIKLPAVKLPKLPTRQQIKKAMPTIMAVTSVVGNVVSVCMMVKRTIKVTRIMDEMHEEGATNKEIAKVVVPKYILPTVIFIGAQVCTIECNILNKRQQYGLATALIGADYRYRRFKDKAKEKLGVEVVDDIQDELALEDFHDYCDVVGNQDDGTSRYIAPEGELLFYDEYRVGEGDDGYFHCTMVQWKQAYAHLNRNYILRGCAVLNELYDFVNIPETNYGKYAGWDLCDSELYWIDIELREMRMTDNMVAYAVEYIYAPQVTQDSIDRGLV